MSGSTPLPDPTTLSPKRTRLTAFAVMLLVAVLAIWVVDRRAVQRMHELDTQATTIEQSQSICNVWACYASLWAASVSIADVHIGCFNLLATNSLADAETRHLD